MTERAQQLLLWSLAIVLVVGTALALRYLKGYSPLAGFAPSSSPLPAGIVLRFDRVRAVGRSENHPAWTLTADNVDTTQGRTRVTFRGNVHAELLQQGKARATMTADRAVYDPQQKVLAVDNGISCKVRDPATGRNTLQIHADDIQWQVNSHLVRSSGLVRATFDNGDTVQGDQMALDIQTRDMSLKNIRATFYVQEGGDTPPRLLQGLNP